MIESIVHALQNQDYKNAARLIKQLQKEQPSHPWLPFHIGRYYEGVDKLEKAENAYRKLLQNTSNPKIISQARQGIKRIQTVYEQRKNQALTEAKNQPGGTELGILILTEIAPEGSKKAAQSFAQIMEMDAYSARLQLPRLGWRLYRTGKMGELAYYVNALDKVGIPCFCQSVEKINQLKVYQVNYFESIEPLITAVCTTKDEVTKKIQFPYSAVSQRVEGLLPLFREAMAMDVRRKFQTTTTKPDYAHFCDLHLPGKQAILRISDRSYQFNQGVKFNSPPQPGSNTIRNHWNQLINLFNQYLPQTKIWSDFSRFAQTALDFPLLLAQIEPQINLSRHKATHWDNAFQLYSSLIFLKELQTKLTTNS